jgi:transcription termination factor Rho
LSDTTELLPEPSSAETGATPTGGSGDSSTTNTDSSTTDSSTAAGPASGATPRRRRTGDGLAGMLLQELQGLAASLGIPGTARMRKGQLVTAIEAARTGSPGASAPRPSSSASGSGARADDATAAALAPQPNGQADAPAASDTSDSAPAPAPTGAEVSSAAAAPPAAAERSDTDQGTSEQAGEVGQRRRRRGAVRGVTSAETTVEATADSPRIEAATAAGAEASAPAEVGEAGEAPSQGDGDRASSRRERGGRDNADRQQNRGDRQNQTDRNQGDRNQGDRQNNRGERQGQGDRNQNDRGDRQNQGDRNQNDRNQNDRNRQSTANGNVNGGNNADNNGGGADDDEFGNGRNRRGRFRDRNRGRGTKQGQGGFADADPVIREDDVLVPIAGILDILDNYAFVRTTGYLTGPNDVYVSLGQVRRYGLRRGDAVTGAVKAPQDGGQNDGGGGSNQARNKYNALVRLDSVNGISPEEAKTRPEFTKMTPLYPNERLRLETEPNVLTTRVIDLVMPIGKGQRALIVSPPKAGKTMVLQAIANAITTNNPECHLMVVLVDERPEEVTDMTRSVKGEVIASTFDRPPSDHTSVAELSIERAKRLVEMGHDVVVLLDSITRLGRAYNLAAPASGRILSGGVDSTALYPPKRFLGAARNIEFGGSLTILATALVETGSTMDTVIFEEFKGTGNAELKLDRRIADKRIFPAVDVDASGTRKEEILLAPEELNIIFKLRRVLHALEPLQAIELMSDRLRKTSTNYEFLMQIAKTTPGE